MLMIGVMEVDNDMDQVEVVDKQRRAESHTQCREDRAGQA